MKTNKIRLEKNSLWATFYIVIAGLLLTGCSKNDGGPDNTSAKYYFSAKIDGVKKESEKKEIYGMHAQVLYTEGIGNQLLVSGRWRTSTTDPKELGGIDLLVQPFPKQKGTFPVGISSSFNVISYWVDMSPVDENEDVYSTEQPGVAGKIVIESFSNGEIRGTFESTAKNENGKMVKITDGSFYMPVDTSLAH